MPTGGASAFENLSLGEAVERFDRVLAEAEADRNRPWKHPARRGHPHSERTKRKLSDATFQRRRAETLLNEPTAVARLRLSAGLTQQAASAKALVDSRTWARAEGDFGTYCRFRG